MAVNLPPPVELLAVPGVQLAAACHPDQPKNIFVTHVRGGGPISQGDEVPCLIQSGASGTLRCVLYSKPTTAGVSNYAVVRAYGFEEIAASTQVIIHIAGIHYVQTANAPTLILSTKTRSFLREYTINSESVLLNAGVSWAARFSSFL